MATKPAFPKKYNGLSKSNLEYLVRHCMVETANRITINRTKGTVTVYTYRYVDKRNRYGYHCGYKGINKSYSYSIASFISKLRRSLKLKFCLWTDCPKTQKALIDAALFNGADIFDDNFREAFLNPELANELPKRFTKDIPHGTEDILTELRMKNRAERFKLIKNRL